MKTLKPKVFARHLLLTALLLSGACFYGAWAQDPDRGGGIGGTGIIGMGPVQGFGSIFVNGREFFLTPNTRISIEGLPGQEAGLLLGDVAIATGTVDARTGRTEAATVVVTRELRGRVEGVDVAAGTLRILGQTAHLLPDTYNRNTTPISLASFMPGDAVTVSGLVRADGTWTVTQIHRVTTDVRAFRLRGDLSGLDNKGGTVVLGTQRLQIVPGYTPSDPVDGRTGWISGHYREDGVAQVENIQTTERTLGAAGIQVEISGHIQSTPVPGQIICNGLLLRYTKDAISNGSLSELRPDMPITVRGTVGRDGSVTVQRMLLRSDFLHVALPRPPGSGSAGKREQSAGPASAPGQASDNHPSSGSRPAVERPAVSRPEIVRPVITHPVPRRP